MNETLQARFMLFMTAVDDDLLEEALCPEVAKVQSRESRWMNTVEDELLMEAAPSRAHKLPWKGLIAAAALCLCVTAGLLFWQSRTPAPTENTITIEDLTNLGYQLPIPEDAQNVRYDLLPTQTELIAQAEFDRGGRTVTLRALRSDQGRDIFDANQVWTDEVNWTAGGTALTLRSNDQTAQVSWYADETQWAVQGEMTPADLLDTVDAIFSALGTQLSRAPEGADDVHYNAFYLDDLPVGETAFTLNGVSCVYRIAPTYDTSADFADISGVEGDFAHRAEGEVAWCPARLAWDEGGAGKVVWFDVVPGQLFSLTVDSGASEEGLLELANALFAPAQGED